MKTIRYIEYGQFYVISTMTENILLGVMNIKYKMFTNMSGRQLSEEERKDIENLKKLN
jgi:hypothetical protein